MKPHPKVDRALRAARRYADGGDVTTADVRRKLADTVTNRATLLPLADYADGSTRLAWPGIMYEPAAAWKRMVDEGPTAEDSFTVASAVPVAGLAAAAVRPGASLGSGGGKLTKSLPMDEASRMARAREMGFDVDRPLYHGTPRPGFDEFDLSRHNAEGGAMFFSGEHPVWGADPAHRQASSYAGREGGVLPVYARGRIKESGFNWNKEPLDVNSTESVGKYLDEIEKYNNGLDRGNDKNRYFQREIAQARREGYDGIVFRQTKDNRVDGRFIDPADVYAMFDPKMVRSKFAAFDPDKIDSANLLAANTTRASAPGLAAIESNRVRGSSLGGEVEVPVVPAFRDGNRYYTGLSHGDAGLKAMEAGVPEYAVAGGASSSQGFLTDRGNFVSRADALKMPGTKNMPRNMGTRNWIDSTDVNTYHGVDTMNPPWAGKVREHPLLAKVPRRPNMEIYSNTSTASVLSLMNQREDR